MPGHLVAINRDADLRLPDVGFQRQVGHALHAPEHVLQRRAETIQFSKVGAIQLERQGGPHAGDQLLHPHLDRLGVGRDHVRNDLFERLLHDFLELLDVAVARPLVLRLERGIDLHVVDVSGLALLCATDHRQRAVHLRELLEGIGDDLAGANGFVERSGGNPGDAPHDRPFLQLRHELLAQEWKDGEAGHQRGHGGHHHDLLSRQGLLQQWLVDALHPRHEPCVSFRFRLQDQRSEHRDQRQAEDQRACHREGDVEGHRLEHLAFEPFQREQRQEHHDDDDDREGNRVRNFLRRSQHRAGAVDFLAMLQALGHDPERVLDHHDRAVHHHPDTDRQTRERHEVG